MSLYFQSSNLTGVKWQENAVHWFGRAVVGLTVRAAAARAAGSLPFGR
jgi:hypothetical protein